MDQYLSTVIIALITGVFSIVTLIIQKRQDKVIDQINEQTTFIEREKTLKQQLMQKEKERDNLIHQIMILILDTNLYIIKNTTVGDEAMPTDYTFKLSEQLKSQFNKVNEEIDQLNKEYKMVLDLTSEIQKKFESEQAKNKKK